MKFLGIDLGTSSIKGVLYDEHGNKEISYEYEYNIISPMDNFKEEDPNDWVKGAIYILKNIAKDNPYIDGISFSGQMHGLVLLDKDDNILRNSIIWCDNRTNNELELINNVIGKEKMKEITGNYPVASFTLAKLLWVKNNEPDIYNKISKVLLPKDYLRYYLTNSFSTELSDASGMQMVNIKTKDYDDCILNKFNIDKNILPKIYLSCDKLNPLKEDIIKLTDLKCDNVFMGAGDQAACAIGSGVINVNDLSLVMGSSGVLFTPILEKDINNLENEVFFHVNGKPFTMAVTNGCGLSYKWFKENLCDYEIDISKKNNINVYELLNKKLEESSFLANGIFYLPYLNGERSPIKDLDATGTFVGIKQSSTKADILMSILEGVGYSLKDCYNSLPKYDYNIRISGGGAKGLVWSKIVASMLNKELYNVSSNDAGCLGAAIISMVGLGVYKSYDEAIDKIIKINNSIKPDLKLVDLYNKNYIIYKDIYNSLKEVYKRMGK